GARTAVARSRPAPEAHRAREANRPSSRAHEAQYPETSVDLVWPTSILCNLTQVSARTGRPCRSSPQPGKIRRLCRLDNSRRIEPGREISVDQGHTGSKSAQPLDQEPPVIADRHFELVPGAV